MSEEEDKAVGLQAPGIGWSLLAVEVAGLVRWFRYPYDGAGAAAPDLAAPGIGSLLAVDDADLLALLERPTAHRLDAFTTAALVRRRVADRPALGLGPSLERGVGLRPEEAGGVGHAPVALWPRCRPRRARRRGTRAVGDSVDLVLRLVTLVPDGRVPARTRCASSGRHQC